MKSHTEWFVKLSFGKYSFLIPRQNIIDGNFMLSTGLEGFDELNLDEIISRCFPVELNDNRVNKILFVREQRLIIETKTIPTVIELDLKKFKKVPLVIRKKLNSWGITSAFFEESTVNCLIDPGKMQKRWEAINDKRSDC